MIKHIWSILCRRSVIDSESNNISIYDVFEQLGVNANVKEEDVNSNVLVNVPLEFETISLWVRENNRESMVADIEIEVIDPNAKTVKTFLQKIEMPKNARRLRSRFKIVGLAVSMSGDYVFKVKIKENGQNEFKIVAEIPLEVNLKKAANNKN